MRYGKESGPLKLGYYDPACDNDGRQLWAIREFWDAVFADPAEFADDYFRRVCSSNKILLAYINERLVGMIHLNPYHVRMDDRMADCYYIVGVAVREDVRRCGIMRCMLEYVMEDMRAQGCPFTFLMPKRQAYYLPFGFEMIYETEILRFQLDRQIICLSGKYAEEEDALTGDDIRAYELADLTPAQLQRLADRINRGLGVKYTFYSERSEAYLLDMLAEHRCQHGGVCILTANEPFLVFSYDIYQTTMYIERFELLAAQDADLLENAVVEILRYAIRHGCEKCCITISKEYDGMLRELCEGGVISIMPEIEQGYGIMARDLQHNEKNSNYIVSKMKNKSFFDEIV